MFSRGVDVEFRGGLLHQLASGDYHDVRVAGEVADEHRKIGVFHLHGTTDKNRRTGDIIKNRWWAKLTCAVHSCLERTRGEVNKTRLAYISEASRSYDMILSFPTASTSAEVYG